jgi:hypothetical protein
MAPLLLIYRENSMFFDFMNADFLHHISFKYKFYCADNIHYL